MNFFEEIEFKNWNELKTFFGNKNSSWCFRGQSNYNWKLTTTMDRVDIPFQELKNYKKIFEIHMIRDFKRHTEFHYDKPYLTKTDFQIISLMQHHGAPSRLLDFTESPYIASFFAVDNCEDECAIYAINYMELLSSTRLLFETQLDDNSDEINGYKYSGSMSADGVFDKLVLGERQFQFVELVQPFSYFERLVNQQGVFLCQGDLEIDFEANLYANYLISLQKKYSPMYKIKIPSKWRMEILKDLDRMNINNGTLFPGLDGHFKSLKNSFDFSVSDRIGHLTKDYFK
jgi:hypothetical protein